MAYESFDEVIATMKRRPKPLVTYIFSQETGAIKTVEEELSSGTMCANDVIQFACVIQLPFGGVGGSGQGKLLSASIGKFNG